MVRDNVFEVVDLPTDVTLPQSPTILCRQLVHVLLDRDLKKVWGWTSVSELGLDTTMGCRLIAPRMLMAGGNVGP